MFEFEVEHDNLQPDSVPDDIKALFRNPDADISAIALIPWEEHCVECAGPDCFKTCDLYTPRWDGSCRRFSSGMSPVTRVPNIPGYIVKVTFKQWAHLFAWANVHMVPVKRASKLEFAFRKTDQIVRFLCQKVLPQPQEFNARQKSLSRRHQARKIRLTRAGTFSRKSHPGPNYFLVEIYNPGDSVVPFTLRMDNPEFGDIRYRFNKLIHLQPGMNRVKIPLTEINKHINIDEKLEISLSPSTGSANGNETILYFGLVTFVTDSSYSDNTKPNRPVKLVIWDLDNTVWDGNLVEDGSEALSLKPQILEVFRNLDERGVVNSVASRNDEQLAVSQLKKFGLMKYITFPRIGWYPKGRAVKQIIRDFNVGEDAVAFIDDSEFERREVKATNPGVRLYSAEQYSSLPGLPEFSSIQSKDSSRRRLRYKDQEKRNVDLESHDGDYLDFLRQCEINLVIRTPSMDSLDRLQELVQRTNQLNYSGNRYSREQIKSILAENKYETYVMECSDRYGDYGTIGFCVVETGTTPCIRDLMFSCRVQSRRVEHAFLVSLFSHYRLQNYHEINLVFVRNKTNGLAERVLNELGFEQTKFQRVMNHYRYSLCTDNPGEDLIRVEFESTQNG